MRSTRHIKSSQVSPPNTRSRTRARNDETAVATTVTGKRRRPSRHDARGEASDSDSAAESDSVVEDEARPRSPSRSRSRSLSIIPTSEMPPLTQPAPEDPAVRALGLLQSARPGAAALTLEYEHLVRMREGHFYRPKASFSEPQRNWNELSISEAAWIRLEEVGAVNKGRSWTSRVGLDEEGDPVKPDLPYVILTKLVIASSPRKMLTLNQIYQAMEERWPYFRVLGQTFRNSIRHNLSMNPAFVNVERPATEGVGAGKGGYWRVSEDKTTSHRGRAKKPRSGTRTSTRNGNVHYVPPMQSEFMSSPTQPEFYSPHPRAYAPYGQPHPPQTFSQTIPPVPFAGKTQLPLPNGNQHCYAGFATPMPPQSETVADSKPSASKIAQLPTRIQPPRAKKARAAEPASGELVQAEMITPRGVEVGPAPEGHVLSTPASAAALSQPSSSRSSVHSAASGPPSLDVPVPSGPDAVTEQQTPPSPSPVRYPGLTLQRQESFVRGSAPGHDSRNSPGKLPTPPSERSSLHIGGGSVYGLTERFSYGLSSERNHQPSQLPSIAALLGPLSPSSSLSVTPPRPT